MTDVYEGSLIRLFRRLEELLRQMGQAAKVMGSSDLEKKFEESLGKIRRDIVVCCGVLLELDTMVTDIFRRLHKACIFDRRLATSGCLNEIFPMIPVCATAYAWIDGQ